MRVKATLSKPLAAQVHKKTQKWAAKPVETQRKVLDFLLKKGVKTRFGKEHQLQKNLSVKEFQQQVPVRDYEGLKPWLDAVVAGETDVLWPGKPKYLAKTSGTTSGTKYIPITKDSVEFHFDAARDSVLHYVHETGRSDFMDRKLMFLSGSPELEEINGILVGRLSGISNHLVPAMYKRNQMPSLKTNLIDDWEAKVEAVADETIVQDMGLIGGIPPWVQMYFDKLQARSGKTIGELFPNLELLVYGGVNFEPYRQKLEASLGRQIPTIETYPASEGFIAYQDSQTEPGMLLLLNHGIFYEFIPVEHYFNDHPQRLTIADVEVGKNYALIMHTTAGLWGYSIGDTVQFVSKNPHRIIVSGRIKHFISAFGEHVIGTEVEQALQQAMQQHPEVEVSEFTVAPQVAPQQGLPFHEWFIAFSQPPADAEAFAAALDQALQQKNSYYYDLVLGAVIRPLVLTALPADAFQRYMKSIGKLGGQNKVPRLSNDRKIADALAAQKQ